MTCFFGHDWIHEEAERVSGVKGSNALVNRKRVCCKCGKTQENNGHFINGYFENKWVTIGYFEGSEKRGLANE